MCTYFLTQRDKKFAHRGVSNVFIYGHSTYITKKKAKEQKTNIEKLMKFQWNFINFNQFKQVELKKLLQLIHSLCDF